MRKFPKLRSAGVRGAKKTARKQLRLGKGKTRRKILKARPLSGEKRPEGRPTLYKEEYAEQARVLCQNGATNPELAEHFGVSLNTIDNWRKHPEFLGALRVGKDAADDRVVRSLYQKANGYTHDAVKIFLSKEGELIYAPYREHVPPSDTAMIFWLKNRRPAEWRDRHEVGLGGEGKPVTMITGTMTVEEAAAAYAATLAGGSE